MASRKKSKAAPSIVWMPRAAQDLVEIDEYIAADDPVAAKRWVTKLIAAAERAGKLPMSGAVVRELGRTDVRQVLVGTYRVIYRVVAGAIHVLAVVEGHKLPPDDLA